MKFSKKGFVILLVGILLSFCTACAEIEGLADGLKDGAVQLGENVTVGKSNALITPYKSFDGSRTSDNMAFQATYDAIVTGFDGQDILIGNTDLKVKDCREIMINYSFDPISGTCQLVYINPKLEETILAENGKGSITIQLESGANYIGLYGAGYEGSIQITVK